VTNILITGGAGFIGCSVGRRLVDRGDRVLAVDVLHPQVHASRERPVDLDARVELIVGDVVEPDTWAEVLDAMRPDVVVHLAAETGTGQSFSESTRHALVNVVGTTRMLDALRHRDAVPGHLVLASSRAVYGEGRWRTQGGADYYPPPRSVAELEAGQWDPIGPDGEAGTSLPSRGDVTVPAPTSVYGATKLAQEHICAAWVSGTGADLSILRFQNVYGPGQSLTNSYTGIVALFARLAAAKEPIDVYEDGAIVRDFVYIDDVARAVTEVIDRPTNGPAIDIGSGTPTTVAELASLIARLEGAPEPVVSERYRIGDIRAASCDPTWAVERLGYEARWELEAGIPALLVWVKATSAAAHRP
jgi:dTDP-L-rhamnose 4-epimerase